jgi:dynein heavy chain 1, cytosolic
VIDQFPKGNHTTPIILWMDKGVDVTQRIEQLAATYSKQLISIAMGSKEGATLADSAISQATKTDSWVVIKNTHLAPSWLYALKKRINSIPRSDMVLFLTIESKNDASQMSHIPLSLLRSCRIVICEQTKGVYSTIIDSLHSIPDEIKSTGPVEKRRILFMLAWLHAVLVERLRYIPMGWSKWYDISAADFEVSTRMIHKTLTMPTLKSRTNINLEEIPWDTIQSLVGDVVYGGKMDQVCDVSLLQILVKEYLNPRVFDSEYKLSGVTVPTGIEYSIFEKWAQVDHPSSVEMIQVAPRAEDIVRRTGSKFF